MYKSVSQYLGSDRNIPVSHLMEPYKNVTKSQPQNYIPQRQSVIHHTRESFQPRKGEHTNTIHNSQTRGNKHLDMHWKTSHYNGLNDPRVWGPAFWFSLHVSAANYPIHPSPIFRERMKGRILSIPFDIPCPSCKPHAAAFIEKHRKKLDEIVSSRQNLFNFYVDFHNKVNQRYGKKIWTYKEAWDLYSNGATVRYLQY